MRRRLNTDQLPTTSTGGRGKVPSPLVGREGCGPLEDILGSSSRLYGCVVRLRQLWCEHEPGRNGLEKRRSTVRRSQGFVLRRAYLARCAIHTVEFDLSSTVNLPHAINFRALCGADVVGHVTPYVVGHVTPQNLDSTKPANSTK